VRYTTATSERGVPVDQPLDPAGQQASLGTLVVELIELDRVVLADVHPQRPRLLAAVVGDHRLLD
jgi:hypothetical protein